MAIQRLLFAKQLGTCRHAALLPVSGRQSRAFEQDIPTRAAVAMVTCIAMRWYECDASLARYPLAVINSASRSVIFATASSEDSRSHDRVQKYRESIYFLTLFPLLYSLLVNSQILSSWRKDLLHFSNEVKDEITQFQSNFY